MQRRAAAVTVMALVLAVAGATGALAAAPRTPAQVVRAWSKALNASNDKAAGALFAPGAVVIQGSVVLRLGTAKLATLWNSRLPCSGELAQLTSKRNVVTATFVLGHRKGHKCDGPGQLAAARFTVVHGKITRWEQVAPPDSSKTVVA